MAMAQHVRRGADTVTLHHIRRAAERTRPYVRATPLVALVSSGLHLKAESLHPTGAFKLRGAFNAILSLSEAERGRGVVAHSSGNHAMAVAYAAARLGVKATIVMPNDAPALKIAGVQRWGADLVVVGPASDERADVADQLSRQHRYLPIPPYDAPQIVAATGVIGLEILRDLPGVETVFAPVSGGGLISGLALALKRVKPSVRVVGVEPEVAADAFESFRAGRLVALPAEQMAMTSADGLRVRQMGALNWAIARNHVDEIIVVSEAAIQRTIALIAGEARLVAEASGAVAAAGALASAARPLGTSVAILSGGNIDPLLFAQAVAADVPGRLI
ncbi:MAG: threonine/serine dehydratase [Caulobacterales bacterium]|nr:threonine/serine dehydratase [Caulobacterales bacterium]